MKILKLTAENFKRLRAVEITPDPTTNLIQVRGKNGAGKSSVLDAIWAAVGGAQAQPSKPVRNGEDKATIRLDLGEIVVTRRFRQDGQTDLRLEAADGARYTSPQTMLDKLIGAIAFDPLEFTRQKPKDQFETLRPLVKLPIDIAALDTANQSDYAIRTNVNRDAAALRVRLDALPVAEAVTSAEPIDVQALTKRLAEASDHNTDIERRATGRAAVAEQIATCYAAATAAETTELGIKLDSISDSASRDIISIDREIANMEALLATLRTRRKSVDSRTTEAARKAREDASAFAASLRANAAADQAKLDAAKPLPDPIDAAALAKEINEANQTNALLDRHKRRADIQTQLTEAEAESSRLTTQMQSRTTQKAEALAAATYPIPGLTLGEGEVLYNDVPLEQASQAEKIRVGVAVAIAANPKLRVIAVRDGSLLDSESMQLLSGLVTEADYQCWIEVTDDDAKIGVIIEDGAIASPPIEMMDRSQPTEEVLPL